MQPPPFEVVSGLQRTSHGAMALALAAEFDDVCLDEVEDALFDLAGRLGAVEDGPADQQLALIGDTLAPALHVTTRTTANLDDLLFHRVVATGRGQALVCATVAVEAARIAGIPLGIVASERGAYLAHRRSIVPLVLAPERGWLQVDVRDLDDHDLAWRCPHGSAALLLEMMLARGRRIGLLDVQLRAAQLCMALPAEDDERHELQLQLARVRAHLN